MRVHFIQHETFEAPGAYLEWARAANHTISFSKVFQYEPLPGNIESFDILVIMGGPQSPATTVEECSHFNAKAEINLIQKAISANKFVIGVCLGAQLIGEALGAKHEHSPEKEIGVFPVQLSEQGLSNDRINHFGPTLNVGHWHSDMPGLTSQSKVLATSIGCPRQIIAYSDRVYGFQCHMELTPEVVELLIASDEEFLLKNTKHQYVQKPDEIRSFRFSEMNEKLFVFLDKLTGSIK